jgi:nicotinate-nucleotide pyrophosphorylase (carboxylating)
MSSVYFDLIIKSAISEDLCPYPEDRIEITIDTRENELIDVTSDAIFGEEEGQARIVAKSVGVLSGCLPVKRIFELLDPSVKLQFHKSDGESFRSGEMVASLEGKVRSILRGERIALNFLGHLSGIATEVRVLARLLDGTRIKILDTRKTIPGMRELEKKAVLHGGGANHRMGLYDMILIKDNHIDAAGSIAESVRRVRQRYGSQYKIEVEARSLEEVEEAASSGIDRILLDNMPKSLVKKAVRLISGRTEIEVSGKMDRKKIKRLRTIPLDYVSAGYITNAAGHSDFSMQIIK